MSDPPCTAISPLLQHSSLLSTPLRMVNRSPSVNARFEFDKDINPIHVTLLGVSTATSANARYDRRTENDCLVHDLVNFLRGEDSE